MDLDGVLVEDQKNDTLLYAGTLQVRITDWFFFKDKADLKYVRLDNAFINLNRTDSTWNYQFLEKYFASSSSSKKEKKPSASAGISFNLKKVVLNNVLFVKKDAWVGSDMTVKIGSMDMDADEISITKKTVAIANLKLGQPYFSILNYTGRRPKLILDDPVEADTTTKNESPSWKIRFSRVTITDGRFRNDKDSLVATTPYFDGQHIDFSKINGTLRNVGWANDIISGAINLSTQERCGLVVKSLKANTIIHPKAMIFDRLYLQTNRSTIRDYYSMRYNDISSMDNFIHAVTMEANFNRSTISSDDIAFFAPDLKTWKKNIKIDGRVKGTVDALSSNDLEVWAGSNTYIHGSISLVGLPNINETLINIESKDLRTTYHDAVNLIPSIRDIQNPNLSKLSYLRFKGTYTGFINDFVTYGTLQTNLGTLQTDLNMKFPRNGVPVYSGTVSTEGFQLGPFINSSTLGLVDFHGTIKGKGFKWQTLDMNIDGIIHKIQYNNYMYQNITAKGTLSDRLFNGDFIMKDPNADLHLKGLVDLTGAKPLFNVRADIAHANLKALQLTNEDLQLSGAFDLNLQGSTLSDIEGSARITNATLLNKGQQMSFDSLVVSSGYINGLKSLKVNSNEFDAKVTGDFDLQELPDAFTVFLSRYYPSYIKPPHRQIKPQAFTFDITTGIVEDYIKLIDTKLTGFNNSHISGSLNTTANTMAIDANVPQFSFKDQYHFSDVELKGSGDLEKLTLTGQAMNTQIGDSLIFPQTTFSIQAQNDISNVTLNATANQAINQASLSAQIKTFSDGATISFNPSTFVLNSKTWTIDQGGELNFRKNTVIQGQVVLHESNQELRLWTQPSPIGDWNDLHVSISKLNIGDISPLVVKSNRLEGLLSGEVVVEDPQNRFNIHSSFHTDELRIDNDSVGQVEAGILYNNKTGMLTGQGNNLDPVHHIDFDLEMNLKDTTNTFQDRISLHPSNFELTILNKYLNGIFSDIKGYVTGDLNIVGKGDNQQFLAKARLKDVSLKVDFTQVTYKIDDTEIELKKDTIDFRNKHIRLRDRFGNTATLDGFIKHHAFQDMDFDLAIQTESRQMELLNTNYNDNQQFYGRAMGSGTFVLVGPESDLLMNIDVKASETDSSFITLPPSRSRESGQASFMVERKYGKEMTNKDLSGSTSNIKYNVDLTTNPLVNIEVILDEVTGDVIRGRGTGNLLISSGTYAPLTIQGRYNIDEGNYLFTFQSILKKPFVLKKGADNYINWSGDPYNANVHLEAVYTAENVSFEPLASSLLTNAGNFNSFRDNVNVVATLTGNLFHPTFNFKLEFPSNNVIYNRPEVAFALQQIEKNPNELNKQVTFLIVTNSFAPYENAANVGFNPFETFTYNTISGLLFGEVNKRLNQLLSKILNNNNLTLNFTGSLYNSNLLDPNNKGLRMVNQSNVNVSVGMPLFNGRAAFTIGGTVDVPLQADIQQKMKLFPDVTLELLINKSGSVRASFFYKQNIDYLTEGSQASTRYGASLSYNKDFDNPGEIFQGKKQGNKKNKNDTSAKNTTDTTSTQ